MAKQNEAWEKWIDRNLIWFMYNIGFGSCPFIAAILIEIAKPSPGMGTLFKPLDAITCGLALFVANFNLIGISKKKNKAIRTALLLVSVMGVFMMGVCTTVVSFYGETAASFNGFVYFVLGASVVLSYVSNRYAFAK